MALTKTERFKKRFKRYVPGILPVSAVLAAATLVLHVVSKRFPTVADAVNLYWGGPLRALAATVSGIVPFSLAEGLLLFSSLHAAMPSKRMADMANGLYCFINNEVCAVSI